MRGVGISLAEKPQKGSARGCREGFSGCSTRPWRDMPPAGWNGFPSGCQGNLWSTPPPLQLRRPPCGCTALELNSQRAHKRTGNRITRIVTRMEKFSDVCEFTDRAHATHTHVRRILDPALLRTAMLNSLFSECPAFPVFLHGFRRWWTDECGSRVSLLLIECQNFLKCIRTKNRVIFFISKKEFWGFKESFVRENEDFIEESKLAAVY